MRSALKHRRSVDRYKKFPTGAHHIQVENSAACSDTSASKSPAKGRLAPLPYRRA